MKQKYKDFIIELKNLTRANMGRTNIISPRAIDELFIKYEINIKEMEDEK